VRDRASQDPATPRPSRANGLPSSSGRTSQRKARGEYARTPATRLAILDAALDRRDDLALARVVVDTSDGLQTLLSLVALAEHNASEPGVVELFCTLSAEATAPTHPAHEFFVNRYNRIREFVGDAFRELADEDRLIEGVDPAKAAVRMVALWDGLQLQWLLNRSLVDLPEELRLFIAGLLNDDPRNALV
jgi:hypothetical protein